MKNKTVCVDVEQLSRILAEEDWSKLTADIPEEDKYEIDMVKKGEVLSVEKVIRSQFASQYFNLKQGYEDLIMSCAKESTDENNNYQTNPTNEGADPIQDK